MELVKKSVIELFPSRIILHNLRLGITQAVGQSFDEQKVNTLTQSEVKRRFDICMNWAITLRGDLGWGTERIVGALGEILRAELSGKRYEPSDRQIWVQRDGA